MNGRGYLERLEKIPHLQRLRIHSRLPVVIPERITDEFCDLLLKSPLKTVFVTHINHPNEIDEELALAMQKLAAAKVTLLNQSVLLKDVNDNPHTLKVLSDKLFQAGILPYYLHLLDKVQGASHFYISDEKALQIYKRITGAHFWLFSTQISSRNWWRAKIRLYTQLKIR